MIKSIFILILTIVTLLSKAQNQMRPLEELINKTDPGWPLVQGWIKSAQNKVEVLPADVVKAQEALYQIQVTTRSPMGSIVYMTGGLLIDNGWIRILGSGNPRLNRSLSGWNKGKAFSEYGDSAPFLLIADDAIGGFYLLNGGQLGEDHGKVYYFSPDNLQYEPLHLTYTEFLQFCFNEDLESFYKGMRWSTWLEDVSKLDGNMVFSFYPFLWSKEGKDINTNSKKEIPIAEQYMFNIDMRRQLSIQD